MASKPTSAWSPVGGLLIIAFVLAMYAIHARCGTFDRQRLEWNKKGVTPLQETMWGPKAKQANVP
jgi:hypothetical protein